MSAIFFYSESFIPESVCRKYRNEGDLMVVLTDNGDIEFLNETASFFFKNANGERSIKEIFDLMLSVYDVDPVLLKEDIINLVKSLQWQRIVRLSIPSAS